MERNIYLFCIYCCCIFKCTLFRGMSIIIPTILSGSVYFTHGHGQQNFRVDILKFLDSLGLIRTRSKRTCHNNCITTNFAYCNLQLSFVSYTMLSTVAYTTDNHMHLSNPALQNNKMPSVSYF